MSIYFTSDLHFGHKKIIERAERPFSSLEEMDATMIARWNERVKPGDLIYVVGDFSFYKASKTKEIYEQLNGQKFLVRGNHDREARVNNLFGFCKDLYTVQVPEDLIGGINGTETTRVQRIELCHYAMRVWNQSHRGAWMLHGHSHGSLPDDPNALSLDVGVDTHDFYPWSYQEIQARMALKTWKPVDHHGRGDLR